MNKKQKQIRRFILIAVVVIGLISGFVSLKIESPKTKDKSKQTGNYEVHEIKPSLQPDVLSGSGMETMTGEAAATSQNGIAAASPVPSATSAGDTTADQSHHSATKAGQNNGTQAALQIAGQDTQASAQSQNASSVQSATGGKQEQASTGQQQNAEPVTKVPVSTEQAKEYITCSIEIRCDDLSNDLNALTDENLKQYIPADGTILSSTSVKVEKGASVYDVLLQICQNHSIQLDTNYTPMYKNYYVKSIQYLYEKKAGPKSGWRYMVNGTFPNYGCSSYKLQQGDVIVWKYSLDLNT